jgi:hypothetical protein
MLRFLESYEINESPRKAHLPVIEIDLQGIGHVAKTESLIKHLKMKTERSKEEQTPSKLLFDVAKNMKGDM